MDTVRIETAQPADAAAIAELYDGPAYTVGFRRFTEDCVQRYPSAIARCGAHVVGFAYGKPFAPDILELDNLYVAAEYRNRKIGSALLGHFETLARTDYAAIILINSSLYERPEPKRPAATFYRRHGYRLALKTSDTDVYGKNLQAVPSRSPVFGRCVATLKRCFAVL